MGSATATVEVRDNLDVFNDLSMQGNRITDLGTPAGDQDAATKKYVDESGGGSVFYGDGSDGQITDSSSKNRGGIIHATTYTLQQGSTLSLDKQYLVIKATKSITINGKIDGEGASNNGGKASNGQGQNFVLEAADGGDGSAGAFIPRGEGNSWNYRKGGAGQPTVGGKGGNGGRGDTSAPYRIDMLRSEPAILQILRETDTGIAAGGGGGGGGYYDVNAWGGSCGSGGDGSYPGGAGGGAQYHFAQRDGAGDGGDGGGLVALMAPKISVSGEIDVSGSKGEDGKQGGGAGGGGSGGVILLHSNTLSEQTPTYDVSGGSGGNGIAENADDCDGEYSGGDGADGADGEVIELVQ